MRDLLNVDRIISGEIEDVLEEGNGCDRVLIEYDDLKDLHDRLEEYENQKAGEEGSHAMAGAIDAKVVTAVCFGVLGVFFILGIMIASAVSSESLKQLFVCFAFLAMGWYMCATHKDKS